MLFEDPNMLEARTYLDWAHGVIENVDNKNQAGHVSGGTKIVLAFTIRQ